MIVWIEFYEPAWDALVALPVDDEGPAAKGAIQRGIIRVIPEAAAISINDRFVRSGEGEAKYLNDLLAVRKRQLGMMP